MNRIGALNGLLDLCISFWEGDTFTYEDVTRNALQYVHDGSSAAEDSMEISVTDGVTTVTTVLRVEVSLPDNNGPQLAPGCLLAITVASKSSVTLSRSHLAYVVSCHLFLNAVNAGSVPFLIPPQTPCHPHLPALSVDSWQRAQVFDCLLTTAAKTGIIDSFFHQGFKAIPV